MKNLLVLFTLLFVLSCSNPTSPKLYEFFVDIAPQDTCEVEIFVNDLLVESITLNPFTHYAFCKELERNDIVKISILSNGMVYLTLYVDKEHILYCSYAEFGEWHSIEHIINP